MKQIEHYRVAIHDTDVNNIASSSAVLRYMQEAAHLQFETQRPTLAELRLEGKAFILSKLNMSVYQPIYGYDMITAETWPCESKGVSFIRCSRILRDGKIIAELSSVWALVDINTRKLLRVTDLNWSVETEPPLELDSPSRIRIPKDIQLALVGERLIGYSDLDLNEHMNNTNYPDMFCDFLPSLIGKRVISISINYASELQNGETIKMYLGENDGVYYIRAIKENGTVGAEAEIVLDEI
jgi:Acyl-ACP thioesterase